MSTRWCFLGSHEIPDGERMVMPPQGSSHICLPCSQTERGKFLMTERRDVATNGHRSTSSSRWSGIYAAMQRPGYVRKRHGG